jgi:Arc/MetJ-type ribon-helix-helix transcriptional regulator
MVRKQIVIEPAQEVALADLAVQRGVSQSELIRAAIEQLLAEAEREQDKRRTHDELMAFFEEGLELGLTDESGKRTWTREDLYDFRGVPRHERDRLRGGSE